MINGIIIGITNFLYRLASGKMMALENHKYEFEYNNAFIKKIFLFQFINANLSIIVLIYQAKASDLKQLNNLLLGQVSMKIVSMFGSRIVSKYAVF